MSNEQQDHTPDIEAIVPDVMTLTVDGVECKVNRLKTKEFLALMRVLTAGLGPGLSQVDLDFSDGETVARDMSALMMLAVPNATAEFAVFLASVVEPIDGGQKGHVGKYLHDNPDLDVMIDVFEAVAVQEKDDLAALAGKLQAVWGRIGTLYAPKMKKQTATPTG